MHAQNCSQQFFINKAYYYYVYKGIEYTKIIRSTEAFLGWYYQVFGRLVVERGGWKKWLRCHHFPYKRIKYDSTLAYCTKISGSS